MKKFYTLLAIVIFLTTNNSLIANISKTSEDKSLKKAITAYKELNYASAIIMLRPIVEKDSSNSQALEMLAYSYKMVKNYNEALNWYEKLNKLNPSKPEWKLYFAEALASKQQYEKSVQVYRDYLIEVPAEKRASSFVNANLKSFEENRGKWNVFFTNLNTLSDDYSPIYYKEGLIFSSNRVRNKAVKRVFKWNNTPFTDLYTIAKLKDINSFNVDSALANIKTKGNKPYRFNDDDTEKTSNDTKVLGIYKASLERDSLALSMNKNLQISLLGGKVNTKFHEGPVAVFPDESIIFTRNNFYKGSKGKSSEGINKLKLYFASNDFNKITEFHYNSDEYSVGHPALSKDGNILIFASDMPGGYGGTDLYYCLKSGKGQWTRPVNLGKTINTEGDEMFPYLDHENKLLFSSTGHAGLGGLDVFEVKLKDLKPLYSPINMGSPINSPEDDFSLIIDNLGKKGYFSSNRSGNDDIYQFSRSTHKITLKLTVKDGTMNIPLRGSRILLRTLDGIDTLHTGPRGDIEKELSKETDYEITAQKLAYVSKNSFTSSVGITKDSVINITINLFKTESNQQWVLNNCDSLKTKLNLQSIYYDLDKSAIRPDAISALENTVYMMQKHPEISIITSSHCDSRASEEYNRALSLRRGYAAKSYLISRGISADRIRVEYYGKTRLTNRCYDGVPCSEQQQQENRRTEFEVVLNGVNLSQLNCQDLN